MNYIKRLAFLITLSPITAMAVVSNDLEFSPLEMQAGKSAVISLKEVNPDGSKVDVTGEYDFVYVDPDPSKAELKLSFFRNMPVIYASVSGSGYVIKATKKDNPGEVVNSSINVTAGAPAKIAIESGNYQSGFGGETVSPLVVKISDNLGNPVESVPVEFIKPDNSKVLINTDLNGHASLAHTLGSVVGKEVITASWAGRSPVIFSLTVKPLATSVVRIGFVSSSISGVENVSLPPIEVAQYDGNNQIVTSQQKNIQIESYMNSSCTVPTQTSISGTKTKSTSSGVATFDDIQHSQAGSIYLKAIAETGEAVCSRAITIKPPISAAAKLAIAAPLKNNANEILFFYPKTTILDQNNREVKTATNSVTVSAFEDANCSVPGSGILSGVNSRSSISGAVTFPGLKYSKVGDLYLKAEADGLESVCSKKIVLSESVNKVVASFRISGLSSSQVQDQRFGFKAQLLNKYNFPISSATDNVTVSAHADAQCSSSASGSLSGVTSKDAISGIVEFKDVSYSEQGTVYIKLASGAASTCSGSVSFVSPPIGSPSKLAWVVSPPSTINQSEIMSAIKLQIVDGAGSNVSKVLAASLDIYSDSTCSNRIGTQVQGAFSSSSGEVVFKNVSFSRLGSAALKVSAGSIQSDCSSVVNVSCPAFKHQENGACVDDSYTPQWAQNFGQCSASAVCSGVGTQSKALASCVRDHDGASVSSLNCAAAVAPSQSCNSPEGAREYTPFDNGTAVETCLAGSTTWNLDSDSILCDSGYEKSGDSCVSSSSQSFAQGFSLVYDFYEAGQSEMIPHCISSAGDSEQVIIMRGPIYAKDSITDQESCTDVANMLASYHESYNFMGELTEDGKLYCYNYVVGYGYEVSESSAFNLYDYSGEQCGGSSISDQNFLNAEVSSVMVTYPDVKSLDPAKIKAIGEDLFFIAVIESSKEYRLMRTKVPTPTVPNPAIISAHQNIKNFNYIFDYYQFGRKIIILAQESNQDHLYTYDMDTAADPVKVSFNCSDCTVQSAGIRNGVLWVSLNKEWPLHELWKTTDGINYTKVAEYSSNLGVDPGFDDRVIDYGSHLYKYSAAKTIKIDKNTGATSTLSHDGVNFHLIKGFEFDGSVYMWTGAWPDSSGRILRLDEDGSITELGRFQNHAIVTAVKAQTTGYFWSDSRGVSNPRFSIHTINPATKQIVTQPISGCTNRASGSMLNQLNDNLIIFCSYSPEVLAISPSGLISSVQTQLVFVENNLENTSAWMNGYSKSVVYNNKLYFIAKNLSLGREDLYTIDSGNTIAPAPHGPIGSGGSARINSDYNSNLLKSGNILLMGGNSGNGEAPENKTELFMYYSN